MTVFPSAYIRCYVYNILFLAELQCCCVSVAFCLTRPLFIHVCDINHKLAPQMYAAKSSVSFIPLVNKGQKIRKEHNEVRWLSS